MKDITGQRFGRLTAIKCAGQDDKKNYYWECKCDCGNAVKVIGTSLRRGNTVSCGCFKAERLKAQSQRTFKDITGKIYGRLTVLKRVENSQQGDAMWLCQCDCGNQTITKGSSLRNGATRSCGCYHMERTIESTTKHSMSGTRLYHIYYGMLDRCYKESSKHYKNHGARGIKVCDEWRNSFPTFMEWASKNGYTDDLTIDRIDNDENYEPSNCRWATAKQHTQK